MLFQVSYPLQFKASVTFATLMLTLHRIMKSPLLFQGEGGGSPLKPKASDSFGQSR